MSPHDEYKEWVKDMKCFEVVNGRAFVGDKLRRRGRVPRWYKIREDKDGDKFVLWRGLRMYLSDIEGGKWV